MAYPRICRENGINDQKIMTNNHIEIILSLMNKDTENISSQSELLDHYYSNATPSEQKIIDTIMTYVCGYSLDTIINYPERIKK